MFDNPHVALVRDDEVLPRHLPRRDVVASRRRRICRPSRHHEDDHIVEIRRPVVIPPLESRGPTCDGVVVAQVHDVKFRRRVQSTETVQLGAIARASRDVVRACIPRRCGRRSRIGRGRHGIGIA